MPRIELLIHGIAKTAGSKRAFALRSRSGGLVLRSNGTPVVSVTDDCAGGKKWRRVVREQAWAQWPRGVTALTGPLRVSFAFTIARRKFHYRTGRFSGTVRDDAPRHHDVKPDALKLARAVEDALTGIAWVDDAQIVDERLTKEWGRKDELRIVIESVT